MSYALETKKRKFDRLLESLSEPVPPPKPATNSSSFLSSLSTTSTARKSSAITSLSDSLKRRRITPTSTSISSKTSTATAPVDLRNVYLPGSRPAFLARLETFRHVTKWHIPSTGVVNAAEWAKRGWCCVDVDTVGCGTCGERVVVDLGSEDAFQKGKDSGNSNTDSEGQGRVVNGTAQDDDEENVQAQIYAALVQRYREIIVTGHSEDCLWRRRGCDSSIQRIQGLLNATTAIDILKTRYEGLKEKIEEIPCVVLNTDSQQQHSSQVNDSELDDLDLDLNNDHKLDALRLALCGWQRRDAEVVECQHCFRSLGLWLYRGEEPAMEHLDAIESHLEYCPWRSADAQDTEIPIPNTGWVDGQQQKAKYPGWVLVYLAVLKYNGKRKGGLNVSTVSLLSDVDGSSIRKEDMSPEQREKRMKDLMKRIKEIKKPFNVKALLRKKTAAA